MPFSVEVQIRQSPIEGHGIFFLRPVKKGQVLWTIFENENSIPIKNRPNLEKNIVWTKNQVLQMSPERVSFLSKYGYPASKFDVLIQLNDGAQFTNHSDNPNAGSQFLESVDQENVYALRDIEQGQELTEDYGNFQLDKMAWLIELQRKYSPQSWQLKNIYFIE